MTILTLADVEALKDFTPGPWLLPATEFEQDEYWGYFGHVGPAMLSGRGALKDDPDARLVAAAPALHATCLHLHAEVARLTAELAEERKPLADAWRQDRDARGPFWWRPGCMTSKVRGEGRRERDLELVAAGWSLVGGVFGEVSDAKT